MGILLSERFGNAPGGGPKPTAHQRYVTALAVLRTHWAVEQENATSPMRSTARQCYIRAHALLERETLSFASIRSAVTSRALGTPQSMFPSRGSPWFITEGFPSLIYTIKNSPLDRAFGLYIVQ